MASDHHIPPGMSPPIASPERRQLERSLHQAGVHLQAAGDLLLAAIGRQELEEDERQMLLLDLRGIRSLGHHLVNLYPNASSPTSSKTPSV